MKRIIIIDDDSFDSAEETDQEIREKCEKCEKALGSVWEGLEKFWNILGSNKK